MVFDVLSLGDTSGEAEDAGGEKRECLQGSDRFTALAKKGDYGTSTTFQLTTPLSLLLVSKSSNG